MNSLPFIAHHTSAVFKPSLHSLPLLHTPSPFSHFLHFHLCGISSFETPAHSHSTLTLPSPRQAAVADGCSYSSVSLNAEGVGHFLGQRASLDSSKFR